MQCDWIVQTHKVYTLEASHQYTTVPSGLIHEHTYTYTYVGYSNWNMLYVCMYICMYLPEGDHTSSQGDSAASPVDS